MKLVAGAAAFGLDGRVFARQQEHPAAIPVDLEVRFAPRPVRAEDRWHLLYELHLTNFGRADLTLDEVDVLAGATSILTYDRELLAANLAQPGSAAGQDVGIIAGGRRAVLFLDVIAPVASTPPRLLRHRVTFERLTPPAGPPQSVVEGGDVRVIDEPPLVLDPPVQGDHWLASHGLSNASSHRRTLLAIDGHVRVAQRFAIDWTRIGADGQVFHGDPARNENWIPYGSDVNAVAAGRIVDLQDGIPENDPTAPAKAVAITLQTAGGNYLVLDVGRGRFVFYAHLMPGSFRVRRGDVVRRGQALAKLGNSGQSDAPHLHLHVVNAPSPLAAEGLPFVFDAFTLEGHVPALSVLADGTGWKPSGPPSQRRHEIPIENAVVGFR